MPLLMLTQWTACNKYVALCHCVHGLPAHSMCSGQLVCSTITLGGPLLAMQPFIDADAECAGQGVDVRKTGVPASFVAALLQSEDAAGRLVAAACGGASTGAGAGGGAGSGSGDASLGPLVTLVRAGRKHCACDLWLRRCLTGGAMVQVEALTATTPLLPASSTKLSVLWARALAQLPHVGACSWCVGSLLGLTPWRRYSVCMCVPVLSCATRCRRCQWDGASRASQAGGCASAACLCSRWPCLDQQGSRVKRELPIIARCLAYLT